MRCALAFAVLALLTTGTLATLGVDVSQATLVNAYQCLVSNGFTFSIIRAYQSNHHPDQNGPHTVYNAWSGGMHDVDVYMFPDPSSNDPTSQVDSMLTYLAQFNVHRGSGGPASFGMVWLDIEEGSLWSGSQSAHQTFFDELVQALLNKGQVIGVYTSESQWSLIMGSWTGGSRFPLWYAHYDGNPSFGDFSPFGGWSRPSIKQYRGDASLCGVGVDENYYPNGDFRNVTNAEQRVAYFTHRAELKVQALTEKIVQAIEDEAKAALYKEIALVKEELAHLLGPGHVVHSGIAEAEVEVEVKVKVQSQQER
jgi:hypothetical protein